MSKEDYGPISQYNSLVDPNLQGFYSKQTIRSHLRQNGLINRRGEIIPEDVWRKKILTKERMEQASRIIANRIVQQAIEIKNLERAEIRRKLEEVSKKELVRRIRGKSSHQLPLLWSSRDGGESSSHSHSQQRTSRGTNSPRLEDYDVQLIDEQEDYDKHRSTVTKPRRRKNMKRNGSSKRRLGTFNKYQRGFSAAPKPEPILLTMMYYGKKIMIPYDTQVFDSKDEITIYQQHCGGENLLVYSGFHDKGEKFSWYSKRHKEYPFSCTIYLNGTYDCRISTCCEYRHNLNCRIGKSGKFGFTSVIGDHPCVRCMWERRENKPKPAEGDDYENEFEVEEDPKTDEEEDEEFSENWIIRVYTSELDDFKGRFAGTDANVYVYLIGSEIETEKFWLNKENVLSHNKNLFERGRIDEFEISTKNDIERPRKLRIGHDNAGMAPGWHLDKVEVVNKRTGAYYVFGCNRWLAENEDDKKIERILELNASPRLEIAVEHGAPARTPSPSPSPRVRLPSPVREKKTPTPTESIHSIQSSRRLTKDDIIKVIDKDQDQVSLTSARSHVSSVSSARSNHSTIKSNHSSRIVKLSSDEEEEEESEKSELDTDTVTGSSSSEDSEDSSSENATKKTKVKKASSSSRHSRYSTMDRTQSGVSSKKSSVKASSRQSAAERKSAVSQKILDSESFIKEQNEEDYVADWTITVHTHEESSELEREEEANVYIYLIGTDNYEDFTTEKFLLDRKSNLSKRADLFKPGSVDTFKVSTNVSIGVPKKVRIGFVAKNSTLGSGWMLNKVELKNSTNGVYEFMYDDWLDDKTSEAVLYESDEMGPSRQRASRPRSNVEAAKKEESRSPSRASRVSVKQDGSRSASRESNGSAEEANNLSRASSLESVNNEAKKDRMVVERSASKQSNKSTASKKSESKSATGSRAASAQSTKSAKSTKSTASKKSAVSDKKDPTSSSLSDTEDTSSWEPASKLIVERTESKLSKKSKITEKDEPEEEPARAASAAGSVKSTKSTKSLKSNKSTKSNKHDDTLDLTSADELQNEAKLVVEEDRAASKISKKSTASKKSVKSTVSTLTQDSRRTSLADMSMNSVSRASFSSEDSEDDTTIHGSDNEGSVYSEAKSNASVAKSNASVAKSNASVVKSAPGGSVHSMLENLAKSISRSSTKQEVHDDNEARPESSKSKKSTVSKKSVVSTKEPSRAASAKSKKSVAELDSIAQQPNPSSSSLSDTEDTSSWEPTNKPKALAVEQQDRAESKLSKKSVASKKSVKSAVVEAPTEADRQSTTSSRQSGTYVVDRSPSKLSKKSLSSDVADEKDTPDNRTSSRVSKKSVTSKKSAGFELTNNGEIRDGAESKASKVSALNDLLDQSLASVASGKFNHEDNQIDRPESKQSKKSVKSQKSNTASATDSDHQEPERPVSTVSKKSVKSVTSKKSAAHEPEINLSPPPKEASRQSSAKSLQRPKTSKANSRASVRSEDAANVEDAAVNGTMNSKVSLRSAKGEVLQSTASLRSGQEEELVGLTSVKSSTKSVRPKSSAKNSKVSLRSEKLAEKEKEDESEESGAYDTAGNYVRTVKSSLSVKEDVKSKQGSKVSVKED